MDHNMVGWFEIPVTDMQRAKAFYDKVFEISISIHDLNEFKMGWFPMVPDKKGSAGSLVQHEMYVPSDKAGALLYFSCADVENELGRVEAAGGSIIHPKKEIGGGHGFTALIKDTEGNRVALHSKG